MEPLSQFTKDALFSGGQISAGRWAGRRASAGQSLGLASLATPRLAGAERRRRRNACICRQPPFPPSLLRWKMPFSLFFLFCILI